MSGTPVVFIHGLWLHASSWEPWIDRFSARGFAPVAPGWPGEPDTVEEARRRPAAVDAIGLDDLVHYYARIVGSFRSEPVLVGHSVGGLVVQRLIGMNLGRGAVAIAPAPVQGIELPSPFARLCSKYPALGNPENIARPLSLNFEQFRYAFANTVTEEESAVLFERSAIPSPGRPLFDAAFANGRRNSRTCVDTGNENRGPLLLISGQEDCLVPAPVTRAVHRLYRRSGAVTELKRFVGRGHSMVIDHGWRAIADYTLAWLAHVGICQAESDRWAETRPAS
ncbi:alpha/beta hydrolase [Streptomyces sp. NPDC005708]|uniref:alpha/beta hydrolase n=1 Tax=Streptomyces sp. NPDC005708 TaxID=3154564 RepID=UPI0033C7BA85